MNQHRHIRSCGLRLPILCVAVEQAVTIAMLGPLYPYMMDKLPAIMLMIVLGIKKGDILRGPPAW